MYHTGTNWISRNLSTCIDTLQTSSEHPPLRLWEDCDLKAVCCVSKLLQKPAQSLCETAGGCRHVREHTDTHHSKHLQYSCVHICTHTRIYIYIFISYIYIHKKLYKYTKENDITMTIEHDSITLHYNMYTCQLRHAIPYLQLMSWCESGSHCCTCHEDLQKLASPNCFQVFFHILKILGVTYADPKTCSFCFFWPNVTVRFWPSKNTGPVTGSAGLAWLKSGVQKLEKIFGFNRWKTEILLNIVSFQKCLLKKEVVFVFFLNRFICHRWYMMLAICIQEPNLRGDNARSTAEQNRSWQQLFLLVVAGWSCGDQNVNTLGNQ